MRTSIPARDMARLRALPEETQIAIRAWTQERMADVGLREGDYSLRKVGPDKPLGSKSFPTVVKSTRALTEQLRDGVKSITFDDGPSGIQVYAWWEDGLTRLLESRVDILGKAKLPIDPVGFIQAFRQRDPARPRTPLFDLFADAYGDKTGPGRTDVLPDVDPKLLLAAYASMWGELDKTFLYFDKKILRQVRVGRKFRAKRPLK